ncbi:MAG: precorrin-2 C(20)-methyltransferase, partial [Omnitrophica bacterium]|nr:precorrin-2 C(20)-methyltransferase [Candidatus Omnitrophota bacterium]
KIVTMVFPMEHNKALLEKFWHKAARRIYKQICLGHNVAFVTIGDPFIYSTYIYLIRKLRAIDPKIVIETVPGISAINAVAALGQVPLAEYKEKIAIIPLPKQIKKLNLYFDLFDTVVLMKVGKFLNQLISFLTQQGLEDSVFFASRIGCPGQYLAKGLKQITKEKSGYLSTMIIRINKTKKAQR